jgi:hypothetical protein
MKVIKTYLFEKALNTVSLLRQEHGEGDLKDFPAVYIRGNKKTGAKAGDRWIIVRPKQENKTGHTQYDMAISGAKYFDPEKINRKTGNKGDKRTRQYTGFNICPENPGKSYGDYDNKTLLFEFTADGRFLKILVVDEPKDAKKLVYERWIAGELSETTAADTLPLPDIGA